MNQNKYLDLLRTEISPAVGCTEPIAIALACAKAREVMPDCDPSMISIELSLSTNVIKNAMGVGIPGTDMVGIPIAAALGAVGGDAGIGLEVLSVITPADFTIAARLVEQKRVSVAIADSSEKLYVKVTLICGKDYSTVVIQREHSHITDIRLNDTSLFHEDLPKVPSNDVVMDTSISELYEFATTCDLETVDFLLEGARMNRSIANEGLLRDYGLRVGKTIRNNIERKIIAEDMEKFAVELAAAAADARMAGCMMPVMTNSGSGNQGITVFLPVVAVAEKLGVTDERLVRALVLSNLTAIHIKAGIGRLSALCGATTAAIGAGCGIAWLLGGDLASMYAVINNMIGDLAGMICDGAKNSCSLKVATSVESAFRSALLAIDRLEVSGKEGIIEDDIEKSIRNLVQISTKGMEETDRMILDIMVSKE